jgi:hypothetical protein
LQGCIADKTSRIKDAAAIIRRVTVQRAVDDFEMRIAICALTRDAASGNF